MEVFAGVIGLGGKLLKIYLKCSVAYTWPPVETPYLGDFVRS